MDKQELVNLIAGKLKEHFHGDIESVELNRDFPVVTINKEKVHPIMKFLKEDPDLNFHFLTDLTGFQTPDEKHLGVIYHLHNMPKNIRLRVKTFFPINHPEISTVSDLWLGANWMERETYDFFGVKFKGHPDLRRILNVDEMDIFPLRKEFPLEDQTREDKNDAMFGR